MNEITTFKVEKMNKIKNTRFKVGDIVMLNPDSEYIPQSREGKGVVMKIINMSGYYDVNKDYIYRIKWEHGWENAYREIDILAEEIIYDIY